MVLDHLILVGANRRDPVAHTPLLDGIQPPPRHLGRRSDTQCLLGPRALLRQRHPEGVPPPHRTCLLSKMALQRVCHEMLAFTACPREESEPFRHHWVCEIVLRKDPREGTEHSPRSEEYRLSIRGGPPATVTIEADSCWGVIHAMSTLRQLIRVDADKTTGHSTAYVEGEFDISDAPTVSHRGAMIDTASTFAPLSRLRQIIDLLSFYKMNALHWAVSASRLGESIHDKQKYTFQDIDLIMKYGYYRGIRVFLEHDPGSGPDASEYRSQIQKMYDALDTPLYMHHFAGRGEQSFRDNREKFFDSTQAELERDTIDRAADQLEKRGEEFIETMGKKDSTRSVSSSRLREKLERQMRLLHEGDKNMLLVIWSDVVKDEHWSRWPQLLVQSSAPTRDMARTIFVPPAWHIDTPGNLSATSLGDILGEKVPSDAFGAEVCFWDPGCPSICAVIGAVASTLWGTGHSSAHTRSLADNLYKPGAPITGHAMDMKDVDGMEKHIYKTVHELADELYKNHPSHPPKNVPPS